jgi:hypothetical protein
MPHCARAGAVTCETGAAIASSWCLMRGAAGVGWALDAMGGRGDGADCDVRVWIGRGADVEPEERHGEGW